MVQVIAIRREDGLVVLDYLVSFAPVANNICLQSSYLLLLYLFRLVVRGGNLMQQLLLCDLVLPVERPNVVFR